MPQPYNATLKNLIAAFPGDWLARLGVPAVEPVEVLSPDLSTVTAAADALLRVGDAVVHIDVQSGPDPDLPVRVLLYNVLAHRETGRPVHSVVVLLRPATNPGKLLNEVRYAVRPGGGLDFRFEVVKVWEVPAEEFLAGGVGLLPLAVIAKPPAGRTKKQAIPDLLVQVTDRAVREVPADRRDLLIASTVILGGMYLPPAEMRNAIRRLPMMIQSSAYEVCGELASIAYAKRVLLQQGEQRFGPPTEAQRAKVEAIDEVPRLERLSLRLLAAADWDALLKTR